MTSVPNYLITACCGDGQSAIINISLSGIVFQEGLHIATNSVTLTFPDGTTFEIIQGQCYTIIAQSNGPFLPSVNYASTFDLDNVQPGASPDCADAAYDTNEGSGCECDWVYTIEPCCEQFGGIGPNALQVNLVLYKDYSDGTYVYDGLVPVEIPNPSNPSEILITIQPGQCYTFTRLNLVRDVLIDLNFGLPSPPDNWLPVEFCEDANCDDCPEPGITYLKYEPCCGGDPIYVRTESYVGDGIRPTIGPIVNISAYTGTFYFEPSDLPSGDFIPGQCYTGTQHTVGSEAAPAPQTNEEYSNLDLAPYESQLTKAGDCDSSLCPECNPIVYELTNCDGLPLLTESDLSAYVGQYIEIETVNGVSIPGCWLVRGHSPLTDTVDDSVVARNNTLPNVQTQPVVFVDTCECPCLCYEVIGYSGKFTYIDCETLETVTVFSSGADKFCSRSRPSLSGREGEDYTLIVGEDCVDGECVPECFILTNCEPLEYPDQDPVLNSNLQSLSQYANGNSVVVLAGYEGCWTVTTATCQCLTITIDGEAIEATATGDTHNGQSVFSFEFNTITYYIWFDGGWFITPEVGNFSNSIASTESTDNCPVFGSFDDPVTPDPAGWRSNPPGVIITTVLCDDQCDCPVDVTVIQDYEDCSDCVGITAYKLRNCEKDNEVIYSIQDLSAYVGQVLKDDCACWIVEEIDYQPPSLTVIENPILYSECETCLATYYQLDNCDESGTPLQIITATNLFPYIGQTIKIEGCTGCFTVSEYTEEEEPENSQDVTVVESFSNCPDCLEVTPRCSTVFNNSTEDRTFTYIDVNGYPQETEVVKSGHFSLRHCVQYWDEPDTFIYNYYGDCNLLDTEIIPTEDCSCFEVTIVPIDPVSGLPTTPIVTNATWNGSLFNGFKVYEVTIDSVLYYIWNSSTTWYITITVGTVSPNAANLKGVTDCPAGDWNVDNTLLPDGRDIDTLTTVEIPCEPVPGKLGICPQYFPNNRKVRPGYNTPICSADKYDKITCKFAGIVYKKVLELRYGISNCCPEEDEKWLIKKELIELQALTDPNYTCDPVTDCCGKQTSQCSCNS